MLIAELHQLVEAVCPIDGVDSTGGITFDSSATEEQKAAALSIVSATTVDGVDTAAEAVVAEKNSAKVSPIIKYLIEHSGQECAGYVHSHVGASDVTDLASAKAALVKLESITAEMARGLSILAKQGVR